MTDVWPAPPFPGPEVLGRGVVVAPGAPTPAGFERARRVRIDDDVLGAPTATADELHRAWVRRQRVVVELAVPNETLRTPERTDVAPYVLGADHAFDRERLFFLVWANAYDLRGGEPQWHLASHYAARLGARPGTVTDVVLPDGTPAWCDGGPRGPIELPSGQQLVHAESIRLGRLAAARYRPPAEPLAPDQLAAVAHPAGPARVIAPAGSGKTRVLTARLRHLLVDRGYEPRLVTAVAYNTRAAAEMRARTGDLDGVDVRTLHSLGLWVCNQAAGSARPTIADERDQRAILDRIVSVGRVPNQDPFQPYLDALSEVRLALRDPAEVEAERDDVPGFADAYPRYRDELRRRGLLDFDEQIHRAIEALLADPALRARAQQRCTHLLVDEFQDLTPAFLLLLRLVSSPARQIFAVGDDDQVIYSYSGASPDFLIDFETRFPGATPYALEVNYRCPPPLVEQAATLLSHNRRRIAKTIRAAPVAASGTDVPVGVSGTDAPAGSVAGTAGTGVPTAGGQAIAAATPPVPTGTRATVDVVSTSLVEADAMATVAVDTVRAWLEGGAVPGDVAVLARVNSALLPVQVMLTDAGVPHDAPLSTTVLGRTGLRSALAWLRVGLDPERLDRDDLMETLRRPSRRVISKVRDELRGRRRWSIDGVDALADFLDGRAQERLREYVADVRALAGRITAGAPTAELLAHIRRSIGLGDAMDALDSSSTRPEGSSHGDDLDALEQLAALHPDPSTFRSWLVEQLRVPPAEGGVTLSTVHRVKGMEWDRVVVFAANAGLFPHRLAEDTEEERRVFHVAITRARRQLAVVASRTATSPFVEQLTTAWTPPVEPPARLPTGTDGGDGAAPGRSSQAGRERATATGRGRATTVMAAGGDGADVVEHRFEALRAWRLDAARDQGVPPYVVFHDDHLRGIAERNPTTLRELGGCHGIGPTKLERYGDQLLELLESLA